jgi:hypothetical protein
MFGSLQRKYILYSTQPPIRLCISLFYKRPNRVSFFRKVRVKLPKPEADYSPPNADVNSLLPYRPHDTLLNQLQIITYFHTNMSFVNFGW